MMKGQRIVDRTGPTLDRGVVCGFPDNVGNKGEEREEGKSPYVAGGKRQWWRLQERSARSTINLEQGNSVRSSSHDSDDGTVVGRARASLR